MVPNIRVQRFPGKVHVCSSEYEVADQGWSVVASTVSDETFLEVFRDSEYVGDLVDVDTTPVDNGPFIELIYTPVPSED
jgi:hypothetical protein